MLTRHRAQQDVHLSTVVEILQSIKQADMTPMLGRMYASPGGAEVLDTLMKYLYDAPRPFPALLPSAFPVACGPGCEERRLYPSV